MATAERTLRYLAARLTEQHTSDLAWWHIPTWTTLRSRMIVSAVATVLANELVIGLGLGLSVGLVFGLMTFFGSSIGYSREVPITITPRRIARLTYRSALQNLMFGLVTGVVAGLLAGLSAGLVSGFSAGLLTGFPVGLTSGLAGVALRGLARHTGVDERSLGPADVWRHDRNAGLVFIPVFGLLARLTVRLVPGLASGLASRLSVVLPLVLLVGLVLGLGGTLITRRFDSTAVSSPGSAALDTAVAAVRLTTRYKLPLRLISFLEDARSRHLLRTVGPVYQFRHAKLQERLAETPQSPT